MRSTPREDLPRGRAASAPNSRPGPSSCWPSGGGRPLGARAPTACRWGAGRPGCLGGGPRLAATLLQRLVHVLQLQGTVVLLGDVQLLGCAVRVPDRQLIHLTRGDLRLVDVRDIHRDRLGTHWNSLARPIGNWNRCGANSVTRTTA